MSHTLKSTAALSIAIVLLLGWACTTGFAQPPSKAKYPDTLFQAPLERPLTLSGSFGELRGGHFHSGLDFTTGERIGKPVKAIADGYVARIKVSATGFGKALYIRHPMGYTSVYAHLHSFKASIATYVKKAQYQQESYQLNLYPGEGKFAVKQGEVIGQSGNSGSSTGPHLHFEIRETRTAMPLNPLFFGFQVKDTKSPVIQGLRLYPINDHSQVKVTFDDHEPVKSSLEPITLEVEKEGSHYGLAHAESICARGAFGVSVAVTDYHDRSSHALGVSQIILKNQDRRIFKSRIDKFRFSQTRYVNAHMDYAANVAHNLEYQRCFVLPGNKLPFYTTQDRGIIQISDGDEFQLVVNAKDAHGNQSTVKWDLKHCPEPIAQSVRKSKPATLKYLPYNAESQVNTPGLRLDFPAGAFYDTVAFTLDQKSKPEYPYGPVYQVHNRFTPVQKRYLMQMDATGVPGPLRENALIIHLEPGSDPEAIGGQFKDGFVEASVRQFGRFTLAVDSLPPNVRLVNVPRGRSYAEDRPLNVRVSDELSGLDSYKPRIDGEWVRMAYDKKNNMLTFQDFGRLNGQNHTLELTVIDNQGNQKTIRQTFQTP